MSKTIEEVREEVVNAATKEGGDVDFSKPPKLTKEKEVELFKALAHKPFKEVGKDLGLHLFFKEDHKMVNFIFNICRRIRKAPDLYGLSQDTVEVVQEAMDKRSIRKNPKIRGEVALQNESFKDKLDLMRDRTAEMIMKKLDSYDKSVKSLEGISIRDLKDLLSVAIDKGRLLRGESTENITKLAKMDVDELSPQEAMKVVMKAREALIEGRR